MADEIATIISSLGLSNEAFLAIVLLAFVVIGAIIVIVATRPILDVYPYLHPNARVRARKGRLFDEKQISELVEANNVEEITNYLRGSPDYAEYLDNYTLEKALDIQLGETYDLVSRMAPKEVQTSFKVSSNTASDVKGIAFNYDYETGSYLALDYRYVDNAYRLYVRHFDGTEWADVWDCDVVLNENEWYDFEIHVNNGTSNVDVDIQYRSGADEYTCVSHTFAFAMDGRKVGYVSIGPDAMDYGLITQIVITEDGITWPDDWSDALHSRNE